MASVSPCIATEEDPTDRGPRGVSVVVAADPATMMEGDEGRFGLALDQLVHHALRCTNRGGHVGVQGNWNGSGVVVSVADDGRGLILDQARSLLRPFAVAYQEPDANAGVGLGLYLVRRIAQAHGGHVWAESHGRDRGCNVYALIPALQPPIGRVDTNLAAPSPLRVNRA